MEFFSNIKRYHYFSRLKNLIFLHLAHLPMGGHGQRPKIIKWGGVKIIAPNSTFIGEGVMFDTVHPEMITIEPGVCITMKSIILTHYIDGITGNIPMGTYILNEAHFWEPIR